MAAGDKAYGVFPSDVDLDNIRLTLFDSSYVADRVANLSSGENIVGYSDVASVSSRRAGSIFHTNAAVQGTSEELNLRYIAFFQQSTSPTTVIWRYILDLNPDEAPSWFTVMIYYRLTVRKGSNELVLDFTQPSGSDITFQRLQHNDRGLNGVEWQSTDVTSNIAWLDDIGDTYDFVIDIPVNDTLFHPINPMNFPHRTIEEARLAAHNNTKIISITRNIDDEGWETPTDEETITSYKRYGKFPAGTDPEDINLELFNGSYVAAQTSTGNFFGFTAASPLNSGLYESDLGSISGRTVGHLNGVRSEISALLYSSSFPRSLGFNLNLNNNQIWRQDILDYMINISQNSNSLSLNFTPAADDTYTLEYQLPDAPRDGISFSGISEHTWLDDVDDTYSFIVQCPFTGNYHPNDPFNFPVVVINDNEDDLDDLLDSMTPGELVYEILEDENNVNKWVLTEDPVGTSPTTPVTPDPMPPGTTEEDMEYFSFITTYHQIENDLNFLSTTAGGEWILHSWLPQRVSEGTFIMVIVSREIGSSTVAPPLEWKTRQ